MSPSSYLTRRRFVKTTAVLCASLAGAGALSACASDEAAAPEADSAPEPEPSAEPAPEAANQADTPAEPEPEPEPTPAGDGNVLVAYFSYPETTEASDPANLSTEEENSAVVVDGQIKGNNEFMADIIARETGADTFRILTTRSYPADHQGLIAQAQEEINAGDRPELAEPIPDLSGYDTVFIGYPIWWAELPPVMHSFLEQADLAGKQIYLFNSHGGSGNAGTKEEIKSILADATVSDDNFVVSRDAVANSEQDIVDWVRGLGF
ncbi:flavodoxin [uncultured Adlercreutzia sp.]|uniref:flavodoxin n=1 Tax=uncultured Adlercreutzia sp. TaxID=875803 RepID=UPI0026F3D469|nr:flavodoxin [uncultured Adlercreutzia sp.]